MKHTKRYLLAAVIGLVMIQFVSWVKGNENFYSYNSEEIISPSTIEKPDVNRTYFYKTSIVKTVKPSSIPFCFESTYDTLGVELDSRR